MRFRVSWLLVLAGLALQVHAVPPADPNRFEKEIKTFEALDRTNQPPTNAVLFVGSSSIRLWTNLAAAFPDWTVVRRGFGGAHLTDVNAFFDRVVLPYRPGKIVLYAGENDLAAGHSPDEVVDAFKTFVRLVRTKLPGTDIYFLSMKPSPLRWHLSPQINEGNARIKRYARLRSDITYIDVGRALLTTEGRPDSTLFEKDRLHLNAKGYERWAREIRQAMQ